MLIEGARQMWPALYSGSSVQIALKAPTTDLTPQRWEGISG